MKETSKNRHTVWLTDEAWKMVGDQYKAATAPHTTNTSKQRFGSMPDTETPSATATTFPARCPIRWKEV